MSYVVCSVFSILLNCSVCVCVCVCVYVCVHFHCTA